MIGILFFRVMNLYKEVRKHCKRRANVKVKTQNDLSLYATLRNDRAGPKDAVFKREGREKKLSGVHRYSKFPSLRYISVRAWRIVENMLVHIGRIYTRDELFV